MTQYDNYCLQARNVNHYGDREFCVFLEREHDDMFQIRTIAYSSTLVLPLKVLSDKHGFQVWTTSRGVLYYPSNNTEDCFIIKDFIRELLYHNKVLGVCFLESIVLHALKLARDAAHDVAHAVADAADAAEGAADAAEGAADAAASVAYDAADAAASVAYDAAAAVAVAVAYVKMKECFKYIIKYRKEVLKDE